MQKIFVAFLKFLSRLTGKNIVYFNSYPEGKKNFTAVKSPLGFWYAGDVRNSADIAYGILNSGMVEPEETKLVIRLLKQLLQRQPIVNFYDIGANTGYYGILSAFLEKSKIRAFAFEPLEENYKYLKESVYLNRLEDYFKIFTLALGDKNSEEIIYGSGTGASLNKEFLDMPKPTETIVAVKRLDDLVVSQNLPLPDFVKIDVEGHELPVLEGSRNILQTALPVLFVEIARSLKNIGRNYENKDYARTFEFLSQFGYKAYCLNGNQLAEFLSDKSTEGVRMFLFIHPQKHKFKVIGQNIL